MDDLVLAEAALQAACGKGYFRGGFLQNRAIAAVVSLAKYNLLCAPISKAVLS